MYRVLFILFIFFMVNVYAGDSNTYNYKEPFIAGLLSFTWGGLGHIYTGHYAQGTFFLTVDTFQRLAFLYMIINFNDRYSRDDGLVTWTEINAFDRTMFVSLIFSFFIVRIWDVYLAVKNAHKYNNARSISNWEVSLSIYHKKTFLLFTKHI